MNVLRKNLWFLNKFILKSNCKTLFFAVVLSLNGNAQIANYISNGSFEADCPTTVNPIYWPGIDSISCSGGGLASECPALGNAPLNGFTYQKARTGGAYMISTFFQPNVIIGYLNNRLKQTLVSGTTYCARFYVNISGNSTYGMDSFGAYFGGAELDTISMCNVPLTYLIPQIQNPTGNIITDTLNWTLITGTFVANGNEKYALIGNFKSDTSVNKILINPTNLPAIATDVCIDDVSCIPIDLPAYAGPNVSVVPGNSVYIGRARDVGIDEACTWYKLPTTITPTTQAIDTAAGIWVSPAQTSTYVVRQQIWCGAVRYDTVVVFMNPLGIASSSGVGSDIKLFPNPANDFLEINVSDPATIKEFKTLTIYDHLGRMIYKEELTFKGSSSKINVSEFSNGVYHFNFEINENEMVNKRFVISR